MSIDRINAVPPLLCNSRNVPILHSTEQVINQSN